MQADHRDVQQDDGDGGNPHIDMCAIQNIEQDFEWWERRHVNLVRDESLRKAPLPKRQFDQRSSINNEQRPDAECPEDFANFAQKRFVLGIQGAGSGLAFTHASRPLPIFLIIQHGSLFSAGSGG